MATITTTVTDLVTTTIASTSTTASSDRASPQGGILEGVNPTQYDPKNPITTFIIQAGIIIIFTRLLHYPLAYIRQPRVIAEVIGGILLGPSVFGRIPAFTDVIFPTDSMPNLSLVANLGLILFLFLVGLEVDLRYLASNWKPALSVGAAGMALPFGLGAAIAWGLFHEFRTEGAQPISFGVYALFIGVAMAITAFPVLCRILTELKLLSTPVGIIVLSAGVGNDVVGWILLALCVALVNAGSGLSALWVLLTCIAFILFLVYAVRPTFMWVLRRNRALEDGPSQAIVALTLLIALTSSFFTGVIGVHPIFGAFLAGLICPHEGGFAISVTEKVEDLVSALFLPLYFALSGLSTNIGLLDSGITWAYVFGVIAIAFVAKFIGGAAAARLNGMEWRESFAIGSLMSCKGLVEIIVLNIGLQAEILSTRTFTIFVVMALVTTFATTPLTAAIYPDWYQKKLAAWKRGEIDWETGEPRDYNDAFDGADMSNGKASPSRFGHLIVYLRLDNMPTLLALISLLGSKEGSEKAISHPSLQNGRAEDDFENLPKRRTAHVHGVRLLELTQRPSTVMKVTEADEYSALDPVLNAFRVLGNLYNLTVSGEVAIAPEVSYADVLTGRAVEDSADLLLLPWSETGGMGDTQAVSVPAPKNIITNDTYMTFVSRAMDMAKSNVGVFVNIGFSGTMKRPTMTLERTITGLSTRSGGNRLGAAPKFRRSHHIFMPFFGGPDDKLALNFLLRLAQNDEVTATITYFKSEARHDNESIATTEHTEHTVNAPKQDKRALVTTEEDAAFFSAMVSRLPEYSQARVYFDTVTSLEPMIAALERAIEEVGKTPGNGGDLIILGRHAETADQGDRTEACLGTAASKFLSKGMQASLLVMQARNT